MGAFLCPGGESPYGGVEPGSKSYPHASLLDWSQAGLGVKHLSAQGQSVWNWGLEAPGSPRAQLGGCRKGSEPGWREECEQCAGPACTPSQPAAWASPGASLWVPRPLALTLRPLQPPARVQCQVWCSLDPDPNARMWAKC